MQELLQGSERYWVFPARLAEATHASKKGFLKPVIILEVRVPYQTVNLYYTKDKYKTLTASTGWWQKHPSDPDLQERTANL